MGYTFIFKQDNNMPDFSKDPCFQKQLEEARAFYTKHPLPGTSSGNKKN
jgi:hypothetical protein